MVSGSLEYVEGVVLRSNERGFTLRGREGWLNVSRYANPAPPIPGEGATVRVGLDNSGFVRTVDLLAPAPEAAEGVTAQPASGPGRETSVTRMACLNTATAILSSGSRAADPEEVLILAERLERWVLR
jgi:hypothetical protein